ncbi:MAG: hypothetical protein HYU64_14030, partial [Armatimonadetes bacterium]|nr:hypothetical protein [Armatimonadota bacterium]
MSVNALSITWQDLLSSGPGLSGHSIRPMRLAGESPPAEAPEEMQEIRACLAGDGDAFARIVLRHQKQVAARMWSFARNRSVLEELVHDVFVEAYVSLKTYRGTAPFQHWLMK